MRISTQFGFQRSLDAIQRIEAQLAETQLQVATGKRVIKPSDDPVSAKRILDLGEAISRSDQYISNANTARARLGLTDTVLNGATNILQRVRQLAVAGENGVLDDSDRQAIAKELQLRLDELLSLGNTRDANNEYLFAGFSSHTQPFTHDGTGVFAYQGDQGHRELQVGPAFNVPVSDSGQAVFREIRNGNGTFVTADNPANTGTGIIDTGSVTNLASWVPDTYTISMTTAGTYEVRDAASALVTSGSFVSGAPIVFRGIQTGITGVPANGDSFSVGSSANQDLFTTVHNLATAFESTTTGDADRARISNAVNRVLTDIDQGIENLSQIRAGIGARLNAVDNEVGATEDFRLQLRDSFAKEQEVDLAEAITRMNQQLTALQAAQQSFVRVQNLSLFNFL